METACSFLQEAPTGHGKISLGNREQTAPEAPQTLRKETSEQRSWAGLDGQIGFSLDLIFLIHCHSHNYVPRF